MEDATTEELGETQWLIAEAPFKFGLTTTGELTVEWVFRTPHTAPSRMGVVVPTEEARKILQNLQAAQTIRDTLSVKPPSQGAH